MTNVIKPAKIDAPSLAHDAMMEVQYGQKIPAHGRVERRIVANLIHYLQANGFRLSKVWDTEEETRIKAEGQEAIKEAMELSFNLDEVYIYFHKKGYSSHYVFLIFGNGNNGLDVITDWSYSNGDKDNFNVVMNAFDAEEFA